MPRGRGRQVRYNLRGRLRFALRVVSPGVQYTAPLRGPTGTALQNCADELGERVQLREAEIEERVLPREPNQVFRHRSVWGADCTGMSRSRRVAICEKFGKTILRQTPPASTHSQHFWLALHTPQLPPENERSPRAVAIVPRFYLHTRNHVCAVRLVPCRELPPRVFVPASPKEADLASRDKRWQFLQPCKRNCTSGNPIYIA